MTCGATTDYEWVRNEPARPTPFPASYDDLVFDADGWSQTIIVDGKRPEWLRDDDRCVSRGLHPVDGWKSTHGIWDELMSIRVRRREPKRETVPISIPRGTGLLTIGTIDLVDGWPDLSTLKIAEDAL